MAPAPVKIPAILTFEVFSARTSGLALGLGLGDCVFAGLVSSRFSSASPRTLGAGEGDFLTTGLAFGVGDSFGLGVGEGLGLGVGVGVGEGEGDGLGDGDGEGEGTG